MSRLGICFAERYDRKQCNNVFWSPQGTYCVVAGVKGMAGTLDFIDTSTPDFTIMNSAEHFMATDVEWDPTGRYVVTGVSYWAQKVGDISFT
jgi:translation initiation factor 3 subunit B